MEVKKVYIWGQQIPGNSPRSKTDVMTICHDYTEKDLTETYPGIWDKKSPVLGDMSGNDTLVYRREIAPGPALMTYEDQPFLLPYLVKGSRKAVIICPGGAYLFKSMINEGQAIAAALNKAGISAFVLWYRSYPYRAPYMFLDCQRAVRYVRYHAEDYGLDPEQIALLGFSAGGHLAAVTSLKLRDRSLFPADYHPDAIDETSSHINALGLVYAALVLDHDKILGTISGKEVFNDLEQRAQFAKAHRVLDQWQKGDAPTFLCAAMDDDVVPVDQFFVFAQNALKESVPCALHLFSQGGHGFGACEDDTIISSSSPVKQWLDLFINWLEEQIV